MRFHLPSQHLLGTHETRGAYHYPGLGYPGGLGDPGDPKIDHPGAIGSEHDVVWFQIPVYQSHGMDRSQSLGDSSSHLEHSSDRERAALGDRPGQGRSVNELGGHPRRHRVQISCDHLRGVETVHFPGDLDLLCEANPEFFILPCLPLVGDLDRHQPTTRRLPEIDLTDAATPAQHSELTHRARIMVL